MPETANLSGISDGARRRNVHVAAFLAGACLVTFLLRVWALWHRGVVDFDETYYYILGRSLVLGHDYRLNGLPNTAFPPLYPMLVGLASLVVPSIRVAASSVSAVAGALLPIPVYFLAKNVHGRRAGLAAAAVAVWPALFFFSASGVTYSMRMYFGSEPLYVVLVGSGMLFMWLFARHAGFKNACLAGIFWGLASLVRNEGSVVFAFLFAWLVVVLVAGRTLWKPRILAAVALMAAVMLMVLSPFLVYVRLVTGRWSLGAKLANNVRIRDTLYDWVVKNQGQGFERRHYSLNADATEMEDPYWGVSRWHREEMVGEGSLSSGLSLVAHPDWRWAPIFAGVFYRGPTAIVPWYGWLFIVLGLFFRPWDGRRVVWWSFATANVAVMFMLGVSLYVLARHELPLVVLFAVSLGKGLDEGGRLAARVWERLSGRQNAFSRFASVLPAAVVLVLFARTGIDLNLAGSLYEGPDVPTKRQALDREVAARLKARLPAGTPLMCHAPWLAVWAGMDWRVTPYVENVAEYAKNRGIPWALLYDWQFGPSGPSGAMHPYIVEKLPPDTGYYLLHFPRRDAPDEQTAGEARR